MKVLQDVPRRAWLIALLLSLVAIAAATTVLAYVHFVMGSDDSAAQTQNFWVSVVSSVAAELTILLTVGLILSAIFYNDPKKDSLGNRLTNLFNAGFYDQSFEAHAKRQVEIAASFRDAVKCEIEISEISPTGDWVKISSRYSGMIKSAIKDGIKNDFVSIGLTTDPIVDKKVQLFGCIEYARVTTGGQYPISEEFCKMVTLGPAKSFRQHYPIRIDGEKGVLYEYRTWVLNKISECFSFTLTRYTKSMELSVINNTTRPISLRIDESVSDNSQIQQSVVSTLLNQDLLPAAPVKVPMTSKLPGTRFDLLVAPLP